MLLKTYLGLIITTAAALAQPSNNTFPPKPLSPNPVGRGVVPSYTSPPKPLSPNPISRGAVPENIFNFLGGVEQDIHSPLIKYCGKYGGRLGCSNHHLASRESCTKLLDQITRAGDESVMIKPRHICYENGDDGFEQCCLSWSKKIRGLRASDLRDPAKKLFDLCNRKDAHGLSSEIWGAVVHNTCAAFCLSNRPNGCKNWD